MSAKPRRKPWTNRPTCPSCKAPAGTRAEVFAYANLCCAACGATWIGDDAEVAKAEKADASWERECKRQEKRGPIVRVG